MPRLDTNLRRPDNVASFTEVVPPTLRAVLREHGVPELARHDELVARYRERAEAVQRARLAVEKATEADFEAEVAYALNPDAKLPAGKAARAQERLEQAVRERDALGGRLLASARALLSAAEPHVAEALARVAAQVDADGATAREALQSALAVLGARGAATAEAVWLDAAQTEARVHPWVPGRGRAPDAAESAIRMAIQAHDDAEQRRRERAEQAVREAEVLRLIDKGMAPGDAQQRVREQAFVSA